MPGSLPEPRRLAFRALQGPSLFEVSRSQLPRCPLSHTKPECHGLGQASERVPASPLRLCPSKHSLFPHSPSEHVKATSPGLGSRSLAPGTEGRASPLQRRRRWKQGSHWSMVAALVSGRPGLESPAVP